MKTQDDKIQKNKSVAAANSVSQKKSRSKSSFHFEDNRPEVVAQRKLQERINNKTIEQNNNVIQRAYAAGTYRLSEGKTRNIEVESGAFTAPGGGIPNPLLDRSILHETMVRYDQGQALAQRFHDATNPFRNSIGLTVAINASYREDGERADAKAQLTHRATQMEALHSNINVTRILWQDGREDMGDSIRAEVPFAELRLHAASDPGSSTLFNYLGTQAKTVWRKMGDDDMPFEDPNGDSEINDKLEILESEDDYRGNLVSFNYNLLPDTDDADILKLTKKIYDAEAKAIEEVRATFDWLQTYAIEPTTYYRAPSFEEGAGKDAGQQLGDYETHADSHNKQIKEGASFSKALNLRYNVEQEYIRLEKAINTSAGGRLDDVVAIFQAAFEGAGPADESILLAALDPALKAVDQSIWDGETLTRGAKWMYRLKVDRDRVDTNVEEINAIINRHFAMLLAELGAMTLRMDRARRQE